MRLCRHGFMRGDCEDCDRKPRDYTIRVLAPEETERIERKVLERLEGTDYTPRYDPGEIMVELIVAADLCATVRHLREQLDDDE